MKKIILIGGISVTVLFVIFLITAKVSQKASQADLQIVDQALQQPQALKGEVETSLPVEGEGKLLQTTNKKEALALNEDATKVPIQQTVPQGKAVVTTETSSTPEVAEYSVAIIGAGIAGLAAANKLKNNDVEHVVILEARERIGGRIWTDTIGEDVIIDLGASWIHGIHKNPINTIAAKNNIQTSSTDYDNSIVYDADGRELDLSDDIWGDFQSYAMETPNKALSKVFDEYVVKENLNKDEARYLSYFITTTVEHELASPVGDTSIASFEVGSEFSGTDVIFPGGYGQIIDILARGSDIRLESPVARVAYGGAFATLTTAAGEKFTADTVISTVPLGVLKNNFIVFNPQLPEKKEQAISTLGMGVLNKAYLLFDEVFWDKDVEIIGFVSQKQGEWAETLNLYPALGKPILLMFNAGAYGKEIEQFTDEEIVSKAVTTLETIYGNIPKPVDYKITRWSSDVWSGGSYSYLPKGASTNVYDDLAEPVSSTLFFAGEATNKKYPATVHGAFLSGERAAQEVIDILFN